MTTFEHNANAGNGVVNVEGTTAYTGDLCAVQCVTACTFTEFAENGLETATKVTEGVAGQIFFNGRGITAVTAASGNKWRGYKRLTY